MQLQNIERTSLFSRIPFFNIWLITLLFKIILAGVLPLSADEAYYWVWAKHLQLSYYDHPPMAGWLFWLGSFLEGWGQLIRTPFVIVGHLTLWVWLVILKDFFPREKIKWWLVLALFSPLIGFGSILGTPDVPVVFFWSLSLYFLLKALHGAGPSSYALLGASLGLGFVSKYHIVLFVPVLFAYLTFEKKWHRVQWSFVLWLIFCGFLFSSPVLLWNLQNDWISFAFQLDHGLGKSRFNWLWPLEYVAGMLVLILPPIIYLALRSKYSDERLTVLRYFTWGPLLFFLFTAFRGSVELNWPIIAFPSLFALAAAASEENGRLIKISAGIWGTGLAIALGVLWVASHPPYTNYLERIEEIAQFEPLYGLTEEYQPLYASSYQMASKIWYETQTPTYKLKGSGRTDFYDFQTRSIPSQTPFYVILPRQMLLPEWARESYNSRVIEERGRFKIVEVDER